MSSGKLIRWGIASAGKISEDFVIALGTLPATDHKVVAVAARAQERAAEFAKKHEIPNAYGSYEELAKSKDVGKCSASLIIAKWALFLTDTPRPYCRCGLYRRAESAAL